MITDWHYRSLFIEIQRRGYRTSEPAGARPERSLVWQKIFGLLREDGLGLSDVASALNVPPEEVVKLVFGLVTVGLPSSGITSTSARRPELRLVSN